VETVNHEPSLTSPYRDDLIKFGFAKTMDGLELWHQYALR
jgi:hypothetical protein